MATEGQEFQDPNLGENAQPQVAPADEMISKARATQLILAERQKALEKGRLEGQAQMPQQQAPAQNFGQMPGQGVGGVQQQQQQQQQNPLTREEAMQLYAQQREEDQAQESERVEQERARVQQEKTDAAVAQLEEKIKADSEKHPGLGEKIANKGNLSAFAPAFLIANDLSNTTDSLLITLARR